MSKIRQTAKISLLAALITITGAVKLPGLVPGTEFQLSAPLAVAICAVFGFSKYILAGILSSVIGLMLGTQNLLNVLIAMIFRLTAGGILSMFGLSWPVVVLAGPIASVVARLSLGGLLGKATLPLLVMAVPGLVYTALTAWPLTLMLKKVKSATERVTVHALQR